MGVARWHVKGGVAVVKKTFFHVAYKKTRNDKCRPVDWVAGMFVNGCGQGCVEKQCGSGVGKINVALQPYQNNTNTEDSSYF